jgi:23S rRNA (guanine745-N1)-methyltransferase
VNRGLEPAVGVAAVLDLLVCPRCRGALWLDAKAARCSAGHAFDLARQGYLNLYARPAPKNADSAAMVAARDRFLAAAHYAPIESALVDIAGRSPLGATVLDCGAGSGHYLRLVLDAVPGGRGVALDVSVAAARRAARAHSRLGAVVADAWQPFPVADRCVDLLLNVFAPRNAAEFARVLRPDGRLVTVHPTDRHLAGLRRQLGLLDVQPAKWQRLTASLGRHFRIADDRLVEFEATWTPDVVRDVVAMGPNAFHLPGGALPALSTGLTAVSVSVQVTTWTVGH